MARPFAFSARARDAPVAVIAMRGSDSTSYPACSQASSPPASGRTSLNPLSISMRATRAAEASFGQVQ